MASMLSGNDETTTDFYRRGNKVLRRKNSKAKDDKSSNIRSRLKAQGVKKDSVTMKRNKIAAKEHGNDDDTNLDRRMKNSWHSHGNSEIMVPLSKKSFKTSEDFKRVESYLDKLELPKTKWKSGARNIINKAKKMLGVGTKYADGSTIDSKNGIIQSLIQPSEAVESNRGNDIISNLLHNIASEVEGGVTPLDDYLDSVPQQKHKTQRNVVTKRPVRKDIVNQKHFLRVLNNDELKMIDDLAIKDN